MFGVHRGGYQLILLIVALLCAASIAITDNALFFLLDDRPTGMFIFSWLIPLFVWFAVLSAKLMLARRQRPLLRLLRYVRINRRWLIRTMLLIAVMAIWSSTYIILKTYISRLVPFYADPMLASMDRMLFGTDPWRISHALIGPFGTMVLDRAYTLWFVLMIAFLAWGITTRNRQFQVISLLSVVLIWFLLGNVLAAAFASVGPCFYQHFYGSAMFEPLMDRLRASPEPLLALRTMNFLQTSFGSSPYVHGISAMPSVHVATSIWFVLMIRSATKAVLPLTLGVIYALMIFVGSFHLGWHYAADGLVSAILTPLIWFGVQHFVKVSAASGAHSGRDSAGSAVRCTI